MKHILKFSLPVLALCATVACSKTAVEPVNPNAGKELISFAGEGEGLTKASLTKAGFTEKTQVLMRVKAEASERTTRYTEAVATASASINEDAHSALVGSHSDLSYDPGYERYWDDAFGRASKLTVYAFAIPGKTDASLLPTWTKEGWSKVDELTNPNWYEDENDEDDTITWEVQTVQDTDEKMAVKNLYYSNNISTNGKGGLYRYSFVNNAWASSLENGVMEWRAKTSTEGETTGKFDQGHLVFQHALAKIQINLKEGAGFDNTAKTDFIWTKNQQPVTQNITLTSFLTEGTFKVSDATWSNQQSNVITTLNEKTGSPAAQTNRQLEAYVIPGNNLYNTSSNVLEFEIDNAQYYVTGNQIAQAIRDYYKEGGAHAEETNANSYRSFEKIEVGKQYVINLTVAKKGIDRITAAVVEWETINSSDADAKNTYPTFDFEDRDAKLNGNSEVKFELYRAAKTASDYITGNDKIDYDWATGYTDKATLSVDNDTKVWTSNWYWENNLTYYHFRAVGDAKGTSYPTIVSSNDVDYFAVKSGAIGGSDYVDYVWGAPFMETSGKLNYSLTDGFDASSGSNHQISYAIGSTDSVIEMLLFHVTSQVFVNVKTTTDPDKVILLDTKGTDDSSDDVKTQVEILNFLADGRVLVGNGLVETTSPARTASVAMTTGNYVAASGSEPAKVNNFSYGFVPQALTWEGGTIGLRITTPDGNQYVVKDLSQCTAAVSSNDLNNPYTPSGSQFKIDRWYPNYQYTYTVGVKKTGIERITASVLPWETVTGDLGVIDLEN